MTKIRINQSISQKQTQSLVIKPKMLQSLEILAAPMIELETFLIQELQKNPMLELVEENPDEKKEEKDISNETEDNNDDGVDKEDQEIKELLSETQELSEVLDSWQEYSSEQYSRLRNDEEADFEQKYSGNRSMITESGEMDEYLEQLEEQDFDDQEFAFAEELIDSVNDHGYLSPDTDIYEMAEQYAISNQRADEIHNIILNFSPKGITARNIEECLQVQLDKNSEFYNELYQLIGEYFQDLINLRYKKISRIFSVNERVVAQWKEIIGHLDPKPGLRILPVNLDYIMPDIIIKKVGNNLEIISNDYSFPKVHLSKNYLDVLKLVKQDRKAVEFVRDKINAAKFLMKSVYLRGRTLENVVRAIIKFQPEFFYEENGALRPLTYAVIAKELDVNESTISRVVRSKYVETPFGLMNLKEFFTSKAGKNENYESVSRTSVEEIIKEFINNEDPDVPLSDQDIADKLADDGLTVSRRVVSKYRKKMGILNSHQRRKNDKL